MKTHTHAVILITFMAFIPNMLFAEQLPANISVYTTPDVKHTLNLLFNSDKTNIELAQRGGARRGGGGQRSRPAGGHRSRPGGVHQRRPVHTRPATRHRATHRAYRHTYRTFGGNRLRLYRAGVGIALVAGARCYAEPYGYGKISSSKCCIGSDCSSNFYVD